MGVIVYEVVLKFVWLQFPATASYHVMSFFIAFKKLFNILTFLLTVSNLTLNLLFLYKSDLSL